MSKPLFDSPTLGRGKLVRDGVAEEIRERGGSEPLFELPPKERLGALVAKVVEEAHEVEAAYHDNHLDADALGDELADLAEALDAIEDLMWLNVAVYRAQKSARRGRFRRWLF